MFSLNYRILHDLQSTQLNMKKRMRMTLPLSIPVASKLTTGIIGWTHRDLGQRFPTENPWTPEGPYSFLEIEIHHCCKT